MKNKLTKIIVVTIIIAIMLQTGFIVYSMVDNQSEAVQETGTNIEVSEQIQNIIKQYDSVNYERNINNYKNLLIELDVHSKFKSEMERLLTEGHALPDILTTYEFLYDDYGKMEYMEILVKEKESGMTWSKIFSNYRIYNPEFIPKSFDFGYLESLMETRNLTIDDI